MKKFIKKITLTMSLIGLSCVAQATELYLYSGAALRGPVQNIIKQYEKNTGNKVIVEYGGSGQILARYNTVKKGDLFLVGAGRYIEKLAQNNELLASSPIVQHIPVMVIAKEKSQGIHSFQDLAQSQLRLGIGDSKAMALGKGAEAIFALSGYQQALEKLVVVKAATPKQLMLYLRNGNIDGAVVGRASVWNQRDQFKILENPKGTPIEEVTLAILSTTKHPKEAKALFSLFNSQQGVGYFLNAGFLPIK